jgi:hypothetical protein
MKRSLLALLCTALIASSVHNTECSFEAIQSDLRSPEYVSDILGGNFDYFIQLLAHGKATNQSRSYTRSVVKLFSNLLKGTQWVNAYAFSDMLTQLPDLIKDHFVLYRTNIILRNAALADADTLDRFNASVSTLLYTKFNNEYDSFRRDPAAFLDEITYQIIEIAEEEVTIEQLRQNVIRFLETAIGKLVWSPKDEIKTWQSVKKIALQLANLMENNIIDDINDLDDLYWSLIHRYCFLLDINATEMPVSFYEEIQQDLIAQQPLLVTLEEQEEFIERKAECLVRVLARSKAKRAAFDRGILMAR